MQRLPSPWHAPHDTLDLKISLVYNIDYRYRNTNSKVISLKEQILRKLFLGFIQTHILYHAQKEPIYGVFMIDELKSHGYDISAGTLYPILNNMAEGGLLVKTNRLVGGKIRKYYSITDAGTEVLLEATAKAKELVREIKQG